MFNFEVKVRPINSATSKIKAMCSIVIDGIIEVDGFKLVNGSNGLFVSPPSHKGLGKDANGLEVEKWYDDVRFLPEVSDDFKRELQEEIIRNYNALSGQTMSQPEQAKQPAVRAVAAANAQVQQQKPASTPTRDKKPLW